MYLCTYVRANKWKYFGENEDTGNSVFTACKKKKCK